jgi:hypothetical protein
VEGVPCIGQLLAQHGVITLSTASVLGIWSQSCVVSTGGLVRSRESLDVLDGCPGLDWTRRVGTEGSYIL